MRIKEFTEFGSGLQDSHEGSGVAEAQAILLGTEQSGHMLNVGYELYCKMLEEAVDTV